MLKEVGSIELAGLEAFVWVARDGSFTRAAERLGIDKSYLSRIVRRLEDRLGARLIDRTTRALQLTEVGAAVYQRAAAMLKVFEDTLAVVRRAHDSSVRLRVAVDLEIASVAVCSWLGSYVASSPEVLLQVEFLQELDALSDDRFDIVVRLGACNANGRSAVKLGEVAFGLFASPSYIRQHGQPQSVEELERYDVVLTTSMSRGQGGCPLRMGDRRLLIAAQPRLQVNTVIGARDAIVGGAGVGLVPDFQARPLVASGLLAQVLPGVDCDPVPVFVIYSGEAYVSPAVRRFVDEAARGLGAVLRAGSVLENAES